MSGTVTTGRLGLVLALLAAMVATGGAEANTPREAWRTIEGAWRVTGGSDLCPEPGTYWVYAFSDSGTHLVLWTGNGSGVSPPFAIPERLGPKPRLHGRAPFYNTRILAATANTLRNRHESLTVTGDRLRIDWGNLYCLAERAR